MIHNSPLSETSISVPDCVSNTLTITNPTINYDQIFKLLDGNKSPRAYKIKVDPESVAVFYEPKDIIRNGPATIVFWKDGTKTIVKLKEGMPDDPYSAFCAALAKKIFKCGSKVKKISAMARLELPKELTK